ncbi:MAG: DUF1295 domain-containing protein [Candidatus Sumerlaeia bacterium]|nr:DUF1295 domain-containing protein [Candidatus Sumerlaeia bacterium]
MIAYAAWTVWAGPASPRLLEAPLWIGQALLLAGALIHLHHYGLLKSWNDRLDKPSTLLMDKGLFRKVRHPMYFGDAVALLGAFAMAGDLLAGAMAVFGIAALAATCIHEDRVMEALFGAEQRTWAATTRRMVPHLW